MFSGRTLIVSQEGEGGGKVFLIMAKSHLTKPVSLIATSDTNITVGGIGFRSMMKRL